MRQKSISESWVEEKNDFLKKNLPKDIQEFPFYPDDNFYGQYDKDPVKGLQSMAVVIFSLLKIEPNGCTIDFYDDKKSSWNLLTNASGVYVKIKDKAGEREQILINTKHKANPLLVAAVLTHEIMHLYLSRLNLQAEDAQENELLTDLATINAGLSILILNGLPYNPQGCLMVISSGLRRIPCRSEQWAFGYFTPKEYGWHVLLYFKDRNISVEEMIGHLTSKSRNFIPTRLFLKGKNTAEFIQILEKQRWKSDLVKGVIIAAVAFVFIYLGIIIYEGIVIGGQQSYGIVNNGQKQDLQLQIKNCRLEVISLENNIRSDESSLSTIKGELAAYEKNQNIENYNNLVDPYNSLVEKMKNEISLYEAKIAECNNLIEQYNK